MTCFFGLHTPRTGGTSLLTGARSSLRRREFYQLTNIEDNVVTDTPDFFELTNYEDLRFVFGHFVLDEMLKFLKGPVLFICLREPIKRAVSNYLWQIGCRRKDGRAILLPSSFANGSQVTVKG